MPRPLTGPPTLVGLCLTLLLVLVASACSAEAGPARTTPAPDQPSAASGTAELAASPVQTKVRLGHVVGRLPLERRKPVRRQVAAVVDGWWDAAYLGGTYPRKVFPSAFPGFTKGAAARARRNKRVMSNQGVGARIESVVPLKRDLTLDVVAVDRGARSVTARFVLRFRTTGQKAGVTVVRGRLFLTRRGGSWRVFGYDVSRSVRA